MGSYVNKLLLFGPPGAGKGTQAAIVAERIGVPHIDTGSIIRENITGNTELGKEAKKYVEAGELVPDELVIRLVKDRLTWDDTQAGWLLDGFPRSIRQAEALSDLSPGGSETVEAVVFIDVPEDSLVARLTSRRICPECKAVYNLITLPPKKNDVCDKCGHEGLIQRTDDNEESVRTRFRVYHNETAPIAEYYEKKKILRKVDGVGAVDEITSRILDEVKGSKAGARG
ncbi:MAG TPA: adenylate kinase [bacterium]|jgi:adenylate kinase